MKRIKKYNESNGPASGKQETTKKGLKFMPLTTENPTLYDDEYFDDSIPDEDNIIDDEDEPQEIKKIKKPKVMKTKRFEEMYENIGPASDSEFAEKLKKQGEPMEEDEITAEGILKSLMDQTGWSKEKVLNKLSELKEELEKLNKK